MDQSPEFSKDKHVAYLLMFLKSKSSNLAAVECHKLFNLYFVLTGLDILDSLDKLDIPRQQIIDYIYSQQCTRFSQQNEKSFGFQGGPYLGFTLNPEIPNENLTFDVTNIHFTGNLVYTFPALCCLIMLGDDLSRVDKPSIIKGLKTLQLENGCFRCTQTAYEYDLRFLYAACAISYLLKDFSGVNIDKACEFILACQSYDYAFGFCPEQESHGAATFLAVACLTLMGKEDLLSNKGQLIQWCLNRQYGGFQGRINKLTDSCYSFWVGGALQILGYEGFVEKEGLTEFLMWCQSPVGGIAKFPEMDFADPVHTLHSLFGLAINKKMGLKNVKALLNITEDAFSKWQNLKD